MLWKRFFWVMALAVVLCGSVVFTGCMDFDLEDIRPDTVLRFHIRANSNSDVDQSVKLECRDAVVTYLESELCTVSDLETAKREIEKRLIEIEKICDKVLKEAGFSYRTDAKFQNEFFPTRSYEGAVLESGYYDAVIVSLGSAGGDNWWCVLYPPLCYLEAQGTGDFRYKSKIKEIWDKYFGE